MKPALSVLIFTVSSGAGYGLLIWMIALQLMGEATVDLRQLLIIGVIGLALVTLGLLSSTLHLTNPKNAWRAFNRFRTSWLSREGVFAIVFYPLALAYGGCLWMAEGQQSTLSMVAGLLTIGIGLITVICTGMIYASLKPIRQWHNPLTTPIYVLFSLLSGALLLLALGLGLNGELSNILLVAFTILLLVVGVAKLLYFSIIGKPDGATINSATGFSQAQVRLLDAGHNADTFLTKEFVFDAGALKLLRLRRLMATLVFALPIAMITVLMYTAFTQAVYLGVVSLMLGLFVERWLFFAEAQHVVNLFYGTTRA